MFACHKRLYSSLKKSSIPSFHLKRLFFTKSFPSSSTFFLLSTGHSNRLEAGRSRRLIFAMSNDQLTQSQYEEFQNRTTKMENMVKTLQNQIKLLQSNQKEQFSSNSNNPNAANLEEEKKSIDESDSKSFGYGKNEYGEYEQPDAVFPKWYIPYKFINRDQFDIKVVNSYLPSTKVPFKPKQGRLSYVCLSLFFLFLFCFFFCRNFFRIFRKFRLVDVSVLCLNNLFFLFCFVPIRFDWCFV